MIGKCGHFLQDELFSNWKEYIIRMNIFSISRKKIGINLMFTVAKTWQERSYMILVNHSLVLA